MKTWPACQLQPTRQRASQLQCSPSLVVWRSSGWTEEDTKHFCRTVYRSLADPDAKQIERSDGELESTFRRAADGGEFTDWPHLIEVPGSRSSSSWTCLRPDNRKPAIVANYPGLAHEDVLACLAYASHLAHEYKAYPLSV